MSNKSNFSIGVAVANCSGAMEADTISKNEASLKSLTSRKNQMKKLIVFFVVLCSSVGLWGQETIKFESIKNVANNGNLNAQYIVGTTYLYGSEDNIYLGDTKLDIKIDRNLSQAIYWLLKAAEKGHKDSQDALGSIYEGQYGGEKDEEKAIYWYQKSLEQGENTPFDGITQFRLGILYEKKGDKTKAEYWYQKSAKGGNVWAQFYLGRLEIGNDDLIMGEIWLQKAANNEHRQAQFLLGIYYMSYDEDNNTALYWLERADKNNDPMSIGQFSEEQKIDCKKYISELKAQGYSSTPTASIGQQVEIIKENAYSSINETDCLTWPNNEIKSKAGKEEWDKFGFIPKNGMKGQIISITRHCDSGRITYILLINNKFYVPISAADIKVL